MYDITVGTDCQVYTSRYWTSLEGMVNGKTVGDQSQEIIVRVQIFVMVARNERNTVFQNETQVIKVMADA